MVERTRLTERRFRSDQRVDPVAGPQVSGADGGAGVVLVEIYDLGE